MEFLDALELQALLHVDKGKLASFIEESFHDKCSTTDDLVCWTVDCLVNARFKEIFENHEVCKILNECAEETKWYSGIFESLKGFLIQDSFLPYKYRKVLLLCIGVAALQFFVQLNWIGPPADTKGCPDLPVFSASFTEECMDELTLCNQPVYPLVQAPGLLVLSKIILHDLEIKTFTSSWWKVRYLSVHQAVLQDKNSAVYFKILNALRGAITDPVYNNKERSKLFGIEAALVVLRFHDITKAKEYLKAVQEDSGLSVKLSGALGNRTQFQQIPYSQLFLHTANEKSEEFSLYPESEEIPVDVKLQDETLLNKVKFINLEPNECVSKLKAEDQALILALSALKQKQSAHDELLTEELNAFADCLLNHPLNFCIQFCALLLRCKLEKQRSKKVERSMMQLQILVDHTQKKTENSWKRFQLFYSTPIPPSWVVEKELANVLLSLGSVKTALEIFLRLEMWEECVFCYQSLQRNDKALEIIESQLVKKRTPLLLCLKGDLTSDLTWYETAWELSGHHYARAKRSIGYYHFQKKEFKECIPHLLDSVEIDSLEQRAWFFLGHAATQVENYELAAKCYRSLINLDQDSFEAWNNLSNAYIRLNDKLRAWRTLQEAIKCNYEQWKIWENYMLVSVDVGAFEEAINACHRLIDIKGKHCDEEVLGILVKAVVQNLNDIHDQPASNLLDKTLKLMGHVTSTDTTSARTWSLYAVLLEHKATQTSDMVLLDRVIQYYQKSCSIIKNEIQKNLSQISLSNCKSLLDTSSTLTDVYLKRHASSGNSTGSVVGKQQLHSARLMIRNTIALAKQAVEHFTDSEANEIISPIIAELEGKLDMVLNILQ